MYVCMYVCMYVYMYTCMYTCIYIYIYICTHVYTYMYICIYVYMCVYTYILDIYIYVLHTTDGVDGITPAAPKGGPPSPDRGGTTTRGCAWPDSSPGAISLSLSLSLSLIYIYIYIYIYTHKYIYIYIYAYTHTRDRLMQHLVYSLRDWLPPRPDNQTMPSDMFDIALQLFWNCHFALECDRIRYEGVLLVLSLFSYTGSRVEAL